MKNFVLTTLLFFISSCTTLPPTSMSLYGDEPVPQKISGSNAQALISRIVQFSKDETFEATSKAFLRLGYNVEDRNEKHGKITGNGFYQCSGSLATPVTIAVYIKQINNKPETKFSIIVDRHSFECWGGGETTAANQIAMEIQKVLSTY